MAAFALIVCLILTVSFAAYVFAPIVGVQLAAGSRRFQLGDLFSLVALWQYPLVLVQVIHQRQIIRQPLSLGHYVLGGLLILMATAIWFGLIEHLTQRGVDRPLRRFVVVAMAVPAGIAATLGLLVAAMAFSLRLSDETGHAAITAAIYVGICTAVGVTCRRLMRWATLTPSSPLEDAESR